MTKTNPKIRIRKRRGDLVHGHPDHWMVEEAGQDINFVTYFSTHAEAIQWVDQKLRKRHEMEKDNAVR